MGGTYAPVSLALSPADRAGIQADLDRLKQWRSDHGWCGGRSNQANDREIARYESLLKGAA